jgi:zinc transporter
VTRPLLERCAGLVFGFAFTGGRARPITEPTLEAALAGGGDWVWLHLALSDHHARRFLESFASLSAGARELLLGTEERIQLHLTPGGGWGVLPDIERDFADEELGAGRLAFWLDGHVLITARRHPLRAAERLRDEIEAGLAVATPAAALAGLVEHFVTLVEARLAVLAGELGRLEDQVLADHGLGQDRLGPLRRELSRYTREFSALRSAVHRATSARRGDSGSPLVEHLPQILQDAEDFDRDAGALSDRARLLYEEIETRIASTTNRSLSALTVISTLLLPPTFVVGAFGMNLEGIPWARDGAGFGFVIGLCLVMVLVGYIVLRRFRILP